MSIPDDGERPPRNPSRGPRPLPSSGFDDQNSTFRPAPGPAAPRPRRPKTGPDDRSPEDASRPDTRGRGRARVSPGKTPMMERVLFGTVKSTDLATFCRQLAGYLEAGVDLLKALSGLEAQFRATALGPVLGRIQVAIRSGDTFSDALEKEPRTFDRLMRSMMRVAEARGGMPEVLRQLASHYENRVRLLRRARSAMIYPTAVILIALAVGYLLTVFVLPPLVGILQDMARGRTADLPAPTRALMAISNFMQAVGWWLMPLLAVGGLIGLTRAYRTTPGKALMDEVALRIPVLGLLLKKLETTRFARTLSTLLEAGVAYDESMRLTADVMHAIPYRRAVDRARVEVMAGHELSDALEGSRRFGVDVIHVISTGESTGKLPESLAHLAEDYEEQVDRMVDNLGQLIQPILTIAIGGVVFFIVLAFVMAYVSVLSGLAGGL
ncbi:type II secretion system F family protein [Tautonia plasticadhaerens]|uniref:General secretion pathway protein F n=1 Tax=Tautonia plasticadhaerens TaxID=2527974 RepID=A0A518GYR6_9BACT|nr:type II secretion system F family protein [Tautonia plasticadhaerens]QDV33746.1 Type II secretion system protein F [Tautonia plasticadhaerens]